MLREEPQRGAKSDIRHVRRLLGPSDEGDRRREPDALCVGAHRARPGERETAVEIGGEVG